MSSEELNGYLRSAVRIGAMVLTTYRDLAARHRTWNLRTLAPICQSESFNAAFGCCGWF